MYTIKQYITDTLKLTKSFVIKLNDIGLVMNKGVYIQTGIKVSSDRTTWKYYLNLSGVKHSTQTDDIYVKVIETKNSEILTVGLLEQYPETRHELLHRNDLFKDLISKYPDYRDYIIGCIQPVDINDAIEAEDGTILSYNEDLVEYNELSMMRVLNARSIAHTMRWLNNEYCITDELYLSGYITSLYNELNTIIPQERLKRIKTPEAHSFHVEHFFRSRLDLWDDVKNLKPETIYWLYNNLDNIILNIGRNETLDLLLEKVFTPNGVGVGTYEINNLLPVLSIDFQDPTKSAYSDSNIAFVTTGLNEAFDELDGQTINTRDLVSKQIFNNTNLDINSDKLSIETQLSSETNLIESSPRLQEKTKVLDIAEGINVETHGIDEITFIMDNWVYAVANNKITETKIVIDPNTGRIYTLTPENGLRFIYLLLSKISSIDLPVSGLINYDYDMVFDHTVDLFNYASTVLDFDTDELISMMNNLKTMDPEYSESEGLSVYIESCFNYYTKVNLIKSNYGNRGYSGTIDILLNKSYLKGSYTIYNSETDLETYLGEENISITVYKEAELLDLLNEVFRSFTGYSVNSHLDKIDGVAAYINILNKLTSYTTQVIRDGGSKLDLFAPYTNSGVIHSGPTLISITDAEISSPWEPYDVEVTGGGNDFKSSFAGIETDMVPDYEIFENLEVILNHDLYDPVITDISQPRATAEII